MTLGIMGVSLFGTCTMKYNSKTPEAATLRPELAEVEPGRFVACHLFTQNTDAAPTGASEVPEHNQQGET